MTEIRSSTKAPASKIASGVAGRSIAATKLEQRRLSERVEVDDERLC